MKMGPQIRLRIYVRYESPSIIRYLEPKIGDVFMARFADCHFNEIIFPALGEKQLKKEITWSKLSLLPLNPHKKQCESEVQKIMHLQEIENQLSDAFTDAKGVTKLYIPAVMLLLRLKSQKNNPKLKSLMSLRHSLSVIDRLVLKIKFLKKKE